MKPLVFALLICATYIHAQSALELPNPFTIGGNSYANARIISANGEKIKFSHDGGIASIPSHELPSELAAELGIEVIPPAPELVIPDPLVVINATYKQPKLKSIEPDGATIIHSEGVAKIPYESMPPVIQDLFGGFDPSAAAEFRQARTTKARQQARANYEKRMKARQARQAAESKPVQMSDQAIRSQQAAVVEFLRRACFKQKQTRKWTKSPTISLHNKTADKVHPASVFTEAVERINKGFSATKIQLIILPEDVDADINFIVCQKKDFRQTAKSYNLEYRSNNDWQTWSRSDEKMQLTKAWGVVSLEQGSTAAAHEAALKVLMSNMGFGWSSGTIFSIMGNRQNGSPTITLSETDKKMIPFFYNLVPPGTEGEFFNDLLRQHWTF